MSQPSGSRDLVRIVLGVLLILLLISGALSILSPFLPALIWATMIVVATWPLLLQLQRGMLLPSISSERTNPQIRFDQTPFDVQRGLTKWEPAPLTRDGQPVAPPRRAGLSSFGVGGSNARLVRPQSFDANAISASIPGGFFPTRKIGGYFGPASVCTHNAVQPV